MKVKNRNGKHGDGDYQVGYRKPPRHAQFKPGTSGNPKGRARARENAGAIARRVLFTPLVVWEGGRKRKIPKFEAMVTQVVNSAIKGKIRNLQLVLGLPWVAAQLARPNSSRRKDAVAAFERAKVLVRGIL